MTLGAQLDSNNHDLTLYLTKREGERRRRPLCRAEAREHDLRLDDGHGQLTQLDGLAEPLRIAETER